MTRLGKFQYSMTHWALFKSLKNTILKWWCQYLMVEFDSRVITIAFLYRMR
jgi:hypothetical protein